MMLAFRFGNWWLLAGLLAAAIPFVLHLLSSVRAQEIYFPTLRFLKRSMEKTARRRRIQHWLLLLLRAALLIFLCLGVAEPVSEATGGWLAGKDYVAVLILDNSMSMATTRGGTSRFSLAKTAASAVLDGQGEARPAMGAVLITNGQDKAPTSLSANRGAMRTQVENARIVPGHAVLLPHVDTAVRLLQQQSEPKKSIFLFSDLQRISFEQLLKAKSLAQAKDIHLLIVNTAAPKLNNVGVTDLKIAGERIVNSPLTFTATLVNSSPVDRMVDVGLRVGGRTVSPLIRKTLRAALGGADNTGSTATVRFQHRFSDPGEYTGEIYIDQGDDLAMDNARRFHLDIGGPVEALVIRGHSEATPTLATDPVGMLGIALEPFAGTGRPWPIRRETIEADQFASTSLAQKDVAFFCGVASFTEEQAAAIADFARGGGTVVFFLGPAVRADNYNQRFGPPAEGAAGKTLNLLPGQVLDAVGEVGPEAQARRVKTIKLDHPYFADLYDTKGEDEYRNIQVWRYFRLKRSPTGQSLLTLENRDDLLLLKRFGSGRVMLCATTASPEWTTLPLNWLFVPMTNRASLLARKETVDRVYRAGAKVTLLPTGGGLDPSAFIKITPPAGEPVRVKVRQTKAGFGIDHVARDVGTYRWEVLRAKVEEGHKEIVHSFVVNPDGKESDLRAYRQEPFVQHMKRQGMGRVYVGDSLGAVYAAALKDAQGTNWWDVLLAFAIVVLVVEAAVANRSVRKDEILIPAHLNARLAT